MEISMKSLMCVAMFALLSSGVVNGSQGPHGGQKWKQSKNHRVEEENRGEVGAVHVVFLPRELQIISEYYAPRYRNLPPGQRKKLARTGQLPPGWQKRMEPFPVEIERQLARLPAGYRRGVMDGHAVIYNPRTQALVDVAVLF
jgi:hypothetical protein